MNEAIRIGDVSLAGPAIGSPEPVAPSRLARAARRRFPERGRGKGFTDEEARTILGASLKAREQSGRYAAAMGWFPWIAAYTGARPGEILRLRQSDVREYDGVPCIVLYHSHGFRRGLFRTVPLHRHLVEQGFLSFAGGSASSMLFLDGVPDREPDAEAVAVRRAARHLTTWVRSLGIPKEVAPNGGWRHRFYLKSRYGNADGYAISEIMGRKLDRFCKFEPTLARLARVIDEIPVIDLAP